MELDVEEEFGEANEEFSYYTEDANDYDDDDEEDYDANEDDDDDDLEYGTSSEKLVYRRRATLKNKNINTKKNKTRRKGKANRLNAM